MRKGNHSKSRTSKGLVLVLAMVLLVGAAVGGTVAWLTDKTEEVQNTFTPSNIGITLTEKGTVDNKQDFKMIPGETIIKKPIVAVDETKTDVDCYLFVEVVKSTNFDTYMTCSVDSGWTKLDGEANVYWREVKTTDPVKSFSVLTGDKVEVLGTVTKGMMESLTAETYPTLDFTAYAVQSAGSANAAEAWAKRPS